jgi:hypothetical protein
MIIVRWEASTAFLFISLRLQVAVVLATELKNLNLTGTVSLY